MQKRILGKSGIAVSSIGLGTAKFGRNVGMKYPASFTLPTDSDMAELLARAAELGINLIDTAPAYGTSEERLGQWLKTQKREDWVICTKAGEEFINGESHFDFSPQAIVQSIERSLKRLHTDYLDIVLVHSSGEDERIIEKDQVFKTLAMLKQAGKIGAYGMSTKTAAGGLLAVDLADVVMVTLNPTYSEDRDVIAHAQKQQKGILIKKAFASGHVCSSIKDNMRFIFSEPGVTSVIVGTINKDHLQENVEAANCVL